MSQVQAEICLLVDFHLHNGGTIKWNALSKTDRQEFSKDCANFLHGERIGAYLALMSSDKFRPILPFETGTRHPSPTTIHDALVTAVKAYNDGGFPVKFSPEFQAEHDAGHAPATTVAVPPPACVQYVWINGVLVAKYNYDLRATSGVLPKAPNGLVANYRIALSYT